MGNIYILKYEEIVEKKFEEASKHQSVRALERQSIIIW